MTLEVRTNASISAAEAQRIQEDVVTWVDKGHLATIYAVCRRTIDNWISQAFISYRSSLGALFAFKSARSREIYPNLISKGA